MGGFPSQTHATPLAYDIWAPTMTYHLARRYDCVFITKRYYYIMLFIMLYNIITIQQENVHNLRFRKVPKSTSESGCILKL